MGSRSDNGGSWPPDGGVPDGLPELPPEWRDIVVPDDLSALADEAAAVRAELDLDRHRTRWQRFTDLRGLRWLRRLGDAGLRMPLLVLTIAVIVTVASLFAAAWPGPARPPAGQRTTGAPGDSRTDLPALEFIGTDGQTVALNAKLPAVILLIDGCVCDRFVAETIAAVRPEIAVVTVVSGTSRTGTPPAGADTRAAIPPTGATPQAQGKTVRELRDPTGELRKSFDLAAPDGTAAALIVGRSGNVVRSVPRTVSVEDFRPDLARL